MSVRACLLLIVHSRCLTQLCSSYRIPRNVVKRGNVEKQESNTQYSEVFAVRPSSVHLLALSTP